MTRAFRVVKVEPEAEPELPPPPNQTVEIPPELRRIILEMTAEFARVSSPISGSFSTTHAMTKFDLAIERIKHLTEAAELERSKGGIR